MLFTHTSSDMIRLNGVEYEFRQGFSLAELVCDHNLVHAKVGFEGFVVIINGAAVPTAQAQWWVLSDNETIYIVPKLDGG